MSPDMSKGVLRDKVDWQCLVNVELDNLKDLFQPWQFHGLIYGHDHLGKRR